MDWADAVATVDGGTEIRVFCQPRAARSAVVGLHGGAVKVKVQAPALEGRANAALEALLAAVLGVPRASVHLTAGEHSRFKRVHVAGLGAGDVATRLAAGVEAPG